MGVEVSRRNADVVGIFDYELELLGGETGAKVETILRSPPLEAKPYPESGSTWTANYRVNTAICPERTEYYGGADGTSII